MRAVLAVVVGQGKAAFWGCSLSRLPVHPVPRTGQNGWASFTHALHFSMIQS